MFGECDAESLTVDGVLVFETPDKEDTLTVSDTRLPRRASTATTVPSHVISPVVAGRTGARTNSVRTFAKAVPARTRQSPRTRGLRRRDQSNASPEARNPRKTINSNEGS